MKWALRSQQLSIQKNNGYSSHQGLSKSSGPLELEHLMNGAKIVQDLEQVILEHCGHHQLVKAYASAMVSMWESRAESACVQYNYQVTSKSNRNIPALDFETQKEREAYRQFGRGFDVLQTVGKIKVYRAIVQKVAELMDDASRMNGTCMPLAAIA